MKNIKANYYKHKSKKNNKPLGDYILLAQALTCKKFSKETIQKNFNKLISKDDYESKDKKMLIQHLYKLSNPTVEEEIKGKNASK